MTAKEHGLNFFYTTRNIRETALHAELAQGLEKLKAETAAHKHKFEHRSRSKLPYLGFDLLFNTFVPEVEVVGTGFLGVALCAGKNSASDKIAIGWFQNIGERALFLPTQSWSIPAKKEEQQQVGKKVLGAIRTVAAKRGIRLKPIIDDAGIGLRKAGNSLLRAEL